MEKRKRIISKDEIENLHVTGDSIEQDIDTLKEQIKLTIFQIDLLETSSKVFLKDLVRMWRTLENLLGQSKNFNEQKVKLDGKHKRTRKSSGTSTK